MTGTGSGRASPTKSREAPSTSNSGPTSTSNPATPTGRVTVDIITPNGVPANVTLVEGGHKALFTKPAGGASNNVSMLLLPGHYQITPEQVVFRGALYNSLTRRSVTVSAGRRYTVIVIFRRAPSASALHATKVTTTSISLAWSAPIGAAFSLRRTADGTPAATRQDGAVVHVSGLTAVDTGLTPGHRYSYALFTKLKGRWAGPITVLAGTSAVPGSTTASYVAAPGTMVATHSEIQAATPTRPGVLLTLAPGVATPVLGTTVVLPKLASLAGGFVGRVSGISAGGRLTLQPAGLSAAFQYYDLNIGNITGPAVRLTPRAVSGSNGTSSPHPPEESCRGVHSFGAITFNPSVRLGGSFHARINTTSFLHAPRGVSLSMDLTATVTGSMSVHTGTSVSCESRFKPIIKTIAADPVPISIVFSPDAAINAAAGVQISNLGATVTGGVRLSVSLGLSSGASFSGTDILTARPLKPDVTANGSVSLNLGGQIIVGPGAGTPDAGVIAGLSGEFDPLDARFGVVFPHNANSCLKASAGLIAVLDDNQLRRLRLVVNDETVARKTICSVAGNTADVLCAMEITWGITLCFPGKGCR